MSTDPSSPDAQDLHAQAAVIAALNDALRRRPGPGWVLTSGIWALGAAFVGEAVAAAAAFENFDPGEDPHGERDFGALEVRGQRLFWKIDYYDLDLEFGSPDPADVAVTQRVLTLMLASEY